MLSQILLILFIGLALVLVGFFVLVLWSLYEAMRESSRTIEMLRQEEARGESEEPRERKRERALGIFLLGPIPIVVRDTKLALLLTGVVLGLVLVFLVLTFIWLFSLIPRV